MTILATDAFTRADAANLGANWTNKRGSCGIFSNAVDSDATDDHVYYNAVTPPDDQWTQVTTVVGATTTNILASGVRLQTAADRSGYYGGSVGVDSGDTIRRLWKWVGAVETFLASEVVAVAASDVLYTEIQGTTLKLFVNGSERLSITDASYSSGQLGLAVYNATIDVAMLDDWSGGDFLVPQPGANAPTQRSRGFNLQQMSDAEDEGRFNELDVRNWWREMMVPA